MKTNPVLNLKIEKEIMRDVAYMMGSWIRDWNAPNQVNAREIAKRYWEIPKANQEEEVDKIVRKLRSVFSQIESKAGTLAAVDGFIDVYMHRVDPHEFVKMHDKKRNGNVLKGEVAIAF